MSKVIKVLIIIVLALAVAFAVVIVCLKKRAKPDTGWTAYDSFPQLQGEWTEVGCGSQEPEKFKIVGGRFSFVDNEIKNQYSFYISNDDNYALNAENLLTISFTQEENPYYMELVYHTQQVDGHEVRIMSSLLFEDDGRGLIVEDEYVHSDDLQYINSDFVSDLYRKLNDQEAPPTYITVP